LQRDDHASRCKFGDETEGITKIKNIWKSTTAKDGEDCILRSFSEMPQVAFVTNSAYKIRNKPTGPPMLPKEVASGDETEGITKIKNIWKSTTAKDGEDCMKT
jgi:hypothetical protein